MEENEKDEELGEEEENEAKKGLIKAKKDNSKPTKFETIIKKYLDDFSLANKEFAVKYANENKNIKECCQFIIGEAKKSAQNNCSVMTDDEVYYLARHYFEEENIKVDTSYRKGTKTSAENVEVKQSETKKTVEKKQKVEKKKDFEQLSFFDLMGE